MKKRFVNVFVVLLIFLLNPPGIFAQESAEKEGESPLGLAAISDFQPRIWFNVPVVGIAMPNGVAEFLYGKKRLKFGLGGGHETFSSQNATFNRSHLFLTQMYYFSTPDYYGYYVKLNEGMPFGYSDDVTVEESWYLSLTAGLKGSLENKLRFFVELGVSLNYLDYQFPVDGGDWSDIQQNQLLRPVLNFGISL